MAESLGTAVLTLSTDSSKFDKGIDRAQSKTQKFGQTLKSVGTTLSKRLTAPLVAAGGVMAKFADTQEVAEARLANAFRNTGAAVQESVADFKAFAGELQQVTRYGDETTIQMASVLQSFAQLSNEGLKQITPVIQDTAAALDMDLNMVARRLGPALAGTTNSLTRFGVELDATMTKEERLATITEQLSNNFGGMAEEIGGAGAASIVQLGNQLGDLAEQFGSLILDKLEPFIQKISSAITFVENLSDTSKTLIVVIGGLAAAIPPLMVAIGALITMFGTTATIITGGILPAIGLLVAGAIAIIENWEGIKDFFADLWEGVKDAFKGMLDWMRNVFVSAWNGYVDFITGIIDKILSIAGKIGGAFGFDVEGIRRIRNELQRAADDVKLIESRSRGVTESFAEAAEEAEGMWTAARSAEEALREGAYAAGDIADNTKDATKELTAYQKAWQSIVESTDQKLNNARVQTDLFEKQWDAIKDMQGAEETREYLAGKIAGLHESIRLEMALELAATGKLKDWQQDLLDLLKETRDVTEDITRAFGEASFVENITSGLSLASTVPEFQQDKPGFEDFGAEETTEQLQGWENILNTFGKIKNSFFDFVHSVPDAFDEIGESIQSFEFTWAGLWEEIGIKANNILKGISSGLTAIGMAVATLSSVTDILNPFKLILDGVMDVLKPLIDDLLSPLIGILKITGQLIGHLLAPALRLLQPLIEFIAEIFVWLYNKIAVPVVNTIAKAFNSIYDFIVQVVNFAIDMLNKIPFVSISRVRGRDPGAGTISEISLADLRSAGGDTTTDGGGDTSIEQARPIDITINISDNELAGEDGFRELALIIRSELESLGVINA